MAKYIGLADVTGDIDVDVLGWDADILKVFSKEIMREALPLMRFEQFANKKTELGTTPGKSITFTKFSQVAVGDSAVAESDNIVLGDTIGATSKSITVSEYAKALGATSYLLETSPLDIMSEVTRILGNHYALTIDNLCRNALDPVAGSGGLSNYIYGGTGNVAASTLVAGDNFTTTVVKDAIETLASINGTSRAGGGYICLAHPHQLRKLRDDPAWINASNYGAPTQLFKGEVGTYENTRFIETNQVAHADTSGNQIVNNADTGANYTDFSTSVNTYHAVFLGNNAYAMAVGLPVEIRSNGTVDFGRKKALAWYSILGIDVLEPTHGVIAVTS